ncbi:MAG: NAD-glutamate dehydrogenase [Alphaproteobacteria bacterium]|nr:NAD-glutamate dehydrogenase [Alphaproteobacteria bacterium]
MLQRSEDAKTNVIRKIATAARRKAKKSGKADVGAFVSAFYENTAPEDILRAAPDELMAAALSAWELVQKRTARKPSIRVFNPSAENNGWGTDHTVIQIVNDDMAFLVDSVTAALNQLEATIHVIVHPLIRVKRDKTGRLLKICQNEKASKASADSKTESLIHIEINQHAGADKLRSISKQLENVLSDVRYAVEDWRTMRVKVAEAIADLQPDEVPLSRAEIEETKSFLRWIDDNHFTFLGYREYGITSKGKKAGLKTHRKSGLGILRSLRTKIFEGLSNGSELPPDIADFLKKPTALMVSKANTRSTVHRSVHLDTIGIKMFDQQGNVIGERLFVGLFTSDLYNHTVNEIPVLRGKVDTIVESAGFEPSSHDAKALMHTLQSLPRDELLQVDVDDLLVTSLGILRLRERQRVALFVHRDPFGRHLSCLVFVPRDRYNTALRRKLQEVLEGGFAGPVTAYYTQVTDSALARVQFIVKTTPGVAPPQTDQEIEERLAHAARDWSDGLASALMVVHGENEGTRLHGIYRDAFPVAYREDFDPDAATADVVHVEKTLSNGATVLDLYRPQGTADHEVRFKLFHRDTPLPLSDVLPVLENMGLRVIDEIPHQLTPNGSDETVWLHDFGLVMRSGAAVDINKVKSLFEDAFHHVWNNEMEDDGFNKLVLGAGLEWRQIVMLRGYCKYLLQAAIPYSQPYLEDTLANQVEITAKLVELFECRFDPEKAASSAKRVKKLEDKLSGALDSVVSLDEDKILRRYLNIIKSTLRTNFYQPAENGTPKPYVSFKIDSGNVDDLPLPRPAIEVFVHSPRVDAVHLRGGKVARGGIRWSDRKEDFRTEILGLMKSQMTKNAVIVPVGAKGGFIVKQPPETGGREAFLEEGIDCYKTFMRGLLDITDNLRSDKVVPPEHVVRHDDDDPYLVVAADKGTATFSDIANGVSQEYGFWLDDAFASGGPVGYDHKAMGITARGAWESVKRHFREMGVDVMTTPFTSVGVGDMSGDVFGNGMIYSPFTKLLGAFNHLHILVDPDPNPATSFKERKRLFDKGRSSWTDYNTKLISAGGGIFERAAKSIKVTPQMRKAFDLPAGDTVTPNELIHAMLIAEVDLLWFGGIGTYIKSRDENNVEVGDRANDTLRINGGQLRAKIVGEGANLGATQLGRIEYSKSGGRINTDFIDNSAGVGCSDHEVNIKILLGMATRSGKLTFAKRNKVLADMTQDVSDLVLMDNYRQSMALTNAEHQSLALADEHLRFMHALERAGDLDREVEFLPSDEDLETRLSAGAGLTRPELSVLLAYAKIDLFDGVLESSLPDDPYLENTLGLYFPKLIQKRFSNLVGKHRLRREIIATYVANTVVNRTGPSFINTISERTGESHAAIARAYLACRQVFGLAELWSGVEGLDNSVPADVQTEMQLEILDLITRGTIWFTRHESGGNEIGNVVRAFQPAVARLDKGLDSILSPALKKARDEKANQYISRKAPKALAQRIANLDALAPACDIVRIAAGGHFEPEAVAKVFYGIGDRFGFDWLRASAMGIARGDEWQKSATAGIVDDLYTTQTRLVTRIMDVSGGADLAPAIIDAWAEANGHAVDRATNMITEIKAGPSVNLAKLSVINRQLGALVAG